MNSIDRGWLKLHARAFRGCSWLTIAPVSLERVTWTESHVFEWRDAMGRVHVDSCVAEFEEWVEVWDEHRSRVPGVQAFRKLRPANRPSAHGSDMHPGTCALPRGRPPHERCSRSRRPAQKDPPSPARIGRPSNRCQGRPQKRQEEGPPACARRLKQSPPTLP